MADSVPQNLQNQKAGSLVERLRSYESDVARLKGIAIAQNTPVREPESIAPLRNQSEIAGKPEPYIEKNTEIADLLAANKTIPEEKQPPVSIPVVTPKEVHIPNRVVLVEPKNNQRYLIISIVIAGVIVLIGGGVYYFLAHPKQPSSPEIKPVLTVTTSNSLLKTQRTQNLIVNQHESLLASLANIQKNPPGTSDEIVRIVVREATTSPELTAQEFSEKLSPTIPNYLVRSFNPQYVFGFYNSLSGWQPVIIFKTEDHTTAFAGMLAWESTIAKELSIFSGKNELETKNTSFKDSTFQGKDIRILRDSGGHTRVVYGFFDPNTIVISTDQKTFEEIFTQLGTSIEK